MKITIESTTQMTEINGVPARIWEGTTDSGIPIHCYIALVAVASDADTTQFERELESCRAPTVVIPARLIL